MREEGGLYVHDLHFLNGDAYCRYVPTMEFEPRKPTALVDIAMELFIRRRWMAVSAHVVTNFVYDNP